MTAHHSIENGHGYSLYTPSARGRDVPRDVYVSDYVSDYVLAF